MNIKQKAVSGVKWNTVSSVIVTLIQILRLSVLTRLLDKSDFGLIAIATMVIGFTDIFSQLGLTVAIIHKQDITEKQYSSVYWTNILLSVVVFSVLWALSPLISAFYEQPILSKIIPLLGIQILLNAFGKMFQTIRSKNLEFDYLAKVKIISTILGFVCTLVLAILDFGVYSLILGQLFQVAFTQFIYAYAGRKEHKILWHLDFREISDFIKIGLYRLGSQSFDFIASKVDVFLIGKFFGMGDLGIYNLAKDLIVRPYGTINMLTSNVASSAFSMIQNELDKVKDYYTKIVTIVTTISIPIYCVLFLCADLIVNIIYGPNYAEVALLLRILTFLGIECSISGQGAILQVSMGRTDVGFKWTVFRIICSVIVIIASSKFGIVSVAVGQLLLAVISVYFFWRLAIKPIINIGFSSYVNSFSRPLIVSAIIMAPLIWVSAIVKFDMMWQALYAIVFVISFLLYYYKFQHSFVKSLISLITSRSR